ncbi:MAG TPA: hypothetical protein VH397_08975 [Xanthobacteraceae bacterium]
MARRLTAADHAYLAAGAVLYVALVSPPVLRLLESRMTTHMTMLLPGLALAGYLCGVPLRTLVAPVSRKWNAGGISGLIAALFTAAFWMLPRALDESLRYPSMEIGKLISIPLLAGVLLAISWPALGPICRGVLKVQTISMLAVLGWLYSVAPVRLCTSYLQSDQEQLGGALCVLAGALALAWALPWMFGSNNAAVEASRP